MDYPKEYQKKVFDISECKVITNDKGLVVIEGYANTKNAADRYGDVPTVFSQIRNYVYEVDDYKKNPIILIDHINSTDHIAGSFEKIVEDEKGLFVRGIFSNSDLPLIKHARTVYSEGHAKAFSIGGIWDYEDKSNPTHLTHALIYEISLVGVGSDPNALGIAYQKAFQIENIKPNTKEDNYKKEYIGLNQKIEEMKQIIESCKNKIGG